MVGRTSDFLAINRYMDPFLGLVAEQLNNFLESSFTGFFVGCPYKITGFNTMASADFS